MKYDLWRIFGHPLWIGLATGVGLVCALMADGPWDALWVALLAIPVAIGGWLSLKKS